MAATALSESATAESRPQKWPSLFQGAVFADGPTTGRVVRTSYGDMQVRIVMKSGRIDAVEVLQLPDRTSTSEKISRDALQVLTPLAIEKQDWDVDVISGATQTSVAFQRAMVYALRAAELP